MSGKHLESLLYRGQFILGPVFADNLDGWQKLSIGTALKITAHPELSLCQRFDGSRSLTLIGYLLDPEHPLAKDSDILDELLGRYSSIQALVDATFRLGGRWLLIAQQGNHGFLFNDPMGLRQAFYTDKECTDGNLWVMSQAGMVAERLGLTMDPLARDYVKRRLSKGHTEYMWPGSSSPFREIRHLLPNHYLDLGTGRCHRFWPNEPLVPITFDEAVERLTKRLPQLVEAAANRFELVLGITAGIDSRLVLAASKSMHQQLSFVSVRQVRMQADHADLMIPANLLRKLELPHEVIHVQTRMSDAFREVYDKSVFLAHAHYGPDAEALLGHFGRTKVAVTGSGSEICRADMRLGIPFLENKPSPEFLAMVDIGGLHPFTIQNVQAWCAAAPHGGGIEFLDLYEWEQGSGNWLAMTQLEFSIAWRDIFTPFNCRDVLISLLAVPKPYRASPDCRIYHELISRLWPEVMYEPINPHKNQTRGKRHFQSIKFLARYGLARALYWGRH
ncbi:MAG: hypothetical protein NUV51_07135 [Sulfuricaulis sp.]|nr:hypothetical protein [Sulfuricaulis sp.]